MRRWEKGHLKKTIGHNGKTLLKISFKQAQEGITQGLVCQQDL